jgi:hypothetical protein
MPTYQKAPAEIRKQVTAVMKAYHGQLRDAEVMVDVLLARPSVDANGDPTGPAIRVHGYAAAAFIRVLSYKDRVIRSFDAEMTLDADRWETSSDAEQTAIIDHELTHLELVTGDGGTVLRDDAERPKLRCRKHDRHFGWFDLVARRHGEDSLEVKQAREMLDSSTFKQCYLFDVCGHDVRRFEKAIYSPSPDVLGACEAVLANIHTARPDQLRRLVDKARRTIAEAKAKENA